MDKTDRGPTEPAPVEDRRLRGLEDKLRTLRDYRRARGLCIKCGEKWSRDHRCSETVQLHVLQEFWDIYHSDDSAKYTYEEVDDTEAQVLFAVSVSAITGKSTVNAIQFQGLVQGRPACILLDSGSSHTFVSSHFADQLQGQSTFSPALHVKIADGKFLAYLTEFKQLDWCVQGCSF